MHLHDPDRAIANTPAPLTLPQRRLPRSRTGCPLAPSQVDCRLPRSRRTQPFFLFLPAFLRLPLSLAGTGITAIDLVQFPPIWQRALCLPQCLSAVAQCEHWHPPASLHSISPPPYICSRMTGGNRIFGSQASVVFSCSTLKLLPFEYICSSFPVIDRGASGTRTRDLLHAMQVRFQLRHGPVKCRESGSGS